MREDVSRAWDRPLLGDVAEAGGWRSLEALQTAYQASVPDTLRRVVELHPTG